MRVRHLMVACLALAACQKAKNEPPVTVPTRSDKLVRAAEPVPGSYLVAMADGLGEADAVALAGRHGATLTGYLPTPVNAALVTIDPSKAIALAEDAAVKLAEEDQFLHVASVEWNLDRIDQRTTAGDGICSHATTGDGVNAYVLDTGILATHPELIGRATQVADFVHRGPAASDCNGHGTHLAGIVAGTNVGVAPAATIHAVRVADCDGNAEASDLAEAIDWVRANHSLPAVVLIGTTGGPSTVLGDAIDALVEGGVSVVGPAGNDYGDACSTVLGSTPSVITVGATSATDIPLASSNRGRCVDLYAPGGAVRSAWNDGGLRLADGTSQAAAHVAGAAALFLEARPGATPANVANALVGNATVGAVSGVPFGSPDRLLYTGFITPAASTDVTAPTVTIDSPASGATVSGDVGVVMTSASADLASVAVYVDGSWIGSDANPADGLNVTWRTVPYANGVHVMTARAYDAAGNAGDAQVSVDVQNEGNAVWDAELAAPVCAGASERCASGDLLAGRGPLGPEANAPNTIRSLCADGMGGTYRIDESVEAVEVQAAIPGHPLVEGDLVNVDVTVWGYPDFTTDRVDLHFARDAGAPSWEYFGTETIPGAGLQTVRFTYRLPAFPDKPKRLQQAVRATVRYGGAQSVCSDGPYDDHDDLAFAVGAGTPDTETPSVGVVRPVPGAVVSGLVNLDASASDPGGGTIGRVELYVDGALVGTAFDPTGSVYRVQWLADAVRLGNHTVVAVAYDTSGNSAQSGAVTLVVKDLSAPTVAIESPLPGASVGGQVKLWAVASDNREVKTVEFFNGTQLVGTAATAPWAIDWDSTRSTGQVTFVAKASDGTNTTISSPVTFRVDNEPPIEVSITSPHAGQEVSGTLAVEIAARDNDGIERVDLYAGGVFVDSANGDGRTTPYTINWNTGLLRNGPVALEARAFDRAGNSKDSATVGVTVNDATPPTVEFVEPAAGALVRGAIDVGVTASDDGVVTRVDFKAGMTPIASDSYAPYRIAWDTTGLADGQVELSATAYDIAENAGTATRTVTVDNHGPTVSIALPAAGTVSGIQAVQVTAADPFGVSRVDLWAGTIHLGELTRVDDGSVPADTWVLQWVTTDFDNRIFELRAVAMDEVGNFSTSDPVAYDIDNPTTAEYSATLKAPSCASAAAWCFSGTLLEGASGSESNQPNTIDGCADGDSSAYQQTESIESIRVAANNGSLVPGAAVTITVGYWAAAANESDQADVYMAANALDPAWLYLGTLTPTVVGLNAGTLTATLPSGPLQVVRANFRFAQTGPSTCSTGAYGDRDDLVFATGSPADAVAPVVTLDAPVSGGTVSGDFLIVATVTDDRGIAKVDFKMDGALISRELLPDVADATRYSTVWPAALAADGPHDLTVTAYDTSGNTTTTAAVTVTVSNMPNAAFDTAYGAPICSTVASFCDTASLLDGRGAVGPEANAPNTLGGSCADGDAGVYHQDESLDWLKVSTVDALPLAYGKRARVEARVWSYLAWPDDALDLYYTSTPADPHWIWFATLNPTQPGAQVLAAEYVIPPGAMQALRGRYRFGGTESACGSGRYDDHDDVAFAVTYTPNGSYDSKLKVPACNTVSAYCDSGTLLDGRATLGPESNAPNTLASKCADGKMGAYHVDSSVDAIVVRTNDLSQLKAGASARLEVKVHASAAFATERVDLFTCANPSATTPTWTFAGSLYPSRAGSQVLVTSLNVTAGMQAIRAHMLPVPAGTVVPAIACGTGGANVVLDNMVDDQDDLVFTAAAQ